MSEKPSQADLFNVVLFAASFFIFAGVLYVALGMSRGAGFFPKVVAAAGIAFSLICIFASVQGREGNPTTEGETATSARQSVLYLFWMAGYIVALWLLGLLIATPLFCTAFMLLQAKANLRVTAVVNAIALGLLYLLGIALSIRWPAGILITAQF